MRDAVLPRMEVWVAESADEIVGYLALQGEMVEQLYIAPQWQRTGVGSLMMEKAKQLRPQALSLYCFAINAPARAFYEKRGFVPVEFSDGQRNEEGLPDVLYRWTAHG
jgi:GNAT superfamily N-acetyltransferase